MLCLYGPDLCLGPLISRLILDMSRLYWLVDRAGVVCVRGGWGVKYVQVIMFCVQYKVFTAANFYRDEVLGLYLVSYRRH